MTGIRLNKFISDTGICSRREADRLIDEGQVRINGAVAQMGTRVADGDQVTVRGKLLKAKPPAVYLVYNKPVGITCTTDREVHGNIVDAVRYPGGRIFPIGRLDKPSEGLILLTNDGDIVNKILRAGNAHEKEYVVTVDKPFDDEFVRRMSQPIPILGTMTRPCTVRRVSADTFNIILTQGLNRQIRRMTEYLGYEVTKLRRVRIMNIRLGGLRPGQWRELTAAEMALINSMVADSSKTEEASLVARPPRSGKPAPRSDNRQRTGRTESPAGENSRSSKPASRGGKSGNRSGQSPNKPRGSRRR